MRYTLGYIAGVYFEIQNRFYHEISEMYLSPGNRDYHKECTSEFSADACMTDSDPQDRQSDMWKPGI